MTVVEVLLILTLVPAGIYCVVALLTLWPKFTRVRYRTGEDWNFPPVFWVANPVEAGSSAPPEASGDVDVDDEAHISTARGGARGNW